MNKLITVIALIFVAKCSVTSGSLTRSQDDDDQLYKVGAGRADVTGPAAQVNMMGYADLSQNTAGIHMRLYSRAFIISKGETRVVFVTVDTAMMSQILTLQIVKRLKAKFGDQYTEKNVCLSGTHTHSVPGGFLQYLMYVFTALGFKRNSFDSLVEGIVLSIERAHQNIQDARIYYSEGELVNANINRSPTSYLLNPLEERNRYKFDVDKDMFLLKFTDVNGKPIGMINWFPVHCTSMNKTNHLISGDNKGLASFMFEQYMDKNSLYGNSSFVAGFAQANEGDVSPNLFGAKCQDTGLSCDVNSTCNGNSNICSASGPGKDMFESTEIIAKRQFEKAKELFNMNVTELKGNLMFAHKYVDMTNITLSSKFSDDARTCPPAMGYSFAAGTTDGPAIRLFHQGMTKHNMLYDFVSGFLLEKPSEEQQQCHNPKPVLINTGEMEYPYAWQPEVVSTQILNIGNLIIAAVPAEFTTMSGRRLKETILQAAKEVSGGDKLELNVVIAGLSNTYSSYVSTYEEYQAQRYEAASTIYGPHTLEAYQLIYSDLYTKMIKREEIKSYMAPPNLLEISEQYSRNATDVEYDRPPKNKHFGDVLQDAQLLYSSESTVEVVFASANPNNHNMLEQTFLTVEMFDVVKDTWKIIATDADWQTKFKWAPNCGTGCSTARIEWDIPGDVQPGRYRIQHHGYYKARSGSIHNFSGASSHFTVTRKKSLLSLLRMLLAKNNY